MRRTLRAATIAVALACAVPAAAEAATPFTAGEGHGHDLAVGSDGTAHVVWLTDEPTDRVGYCRVPAGGSACDSESALLHFPSLGGASSIGDHAQVFAPAPGKVVILASCGQCGFSGGEHTFRWISTNNGEAFSATPADVGTLRLDGQAGYLNAGDVGLGVQGRLFQGMSSPIELTLGGDGYGQSPAVVPVPGAAKVVHAVSDGTRVQYAVFTDPAPGGITASELNTMAYWQTKKALYQAESDNQETHLSSGPSGIFLSYLHFVPNDNRIGLRKFDSATNAFGAPTYVEGPDAIDDKSADYPHQSQDPDGRLHVVWRTLHDGGRLRYRRSDDGGASFSAAANLAAGETFIDPLVEAGPGGTGFAVWKDIGNSPIRVVRIDPQPEPTPAPVPPTSPAPTTTAPIAPAPDAAAPGIAGLGVGDATLTPGQGTRFTFTSSESGLAVLKIQKRVPGLKMRKSGRAVCVPRTRKRLRALRSPRPCRAYEKVGSIRRQVQAGRTEIAFSGRVAGRRLAPGSYRAVLRISDAAGNLSRKETVRFRVVRKRG